MKLRAVFAVIAGAWLLKAAPALAVDTRADEGWTFNPIAVKRDPFEAPIVAKKEFVNELRLFDLNEINLVAILTGMGSPQAMIVLPNGKTHIVQVRDPIGRHNGHVHRITSNEVVIEESFKDFKGRDKKNLTNLILSQ